MALQTVTGLVGREEDPAKPRDSSDGPESTIQLHQLPQAPSGNGSALN